MRLRAIWFVIAACSCVPPTDVPAAVETSRVEYKDLPITAGRSIDLLFVLDSSPAMRAHRDHLATNTRNFMNVLNTIEGGLPIVHIGVVSADLGTTGALDDVAGPQVGDRCAGRGDGGAFRRITTVDGDYLVDLILADRTRPHNYTGLLPDVFAELARVGDDGCELVQPLEAMRRALRSDPSFLRPAAFLMVVFVTAQDDCSFPRASFLDGLRVDPVDTYRCYARAQDLVPVEDYVGFLKSVKSDPSQVIVALASGPAAPIDVTYEGRQRFVDLACDAGGLAGYPAPRLHRLLQQFPNRSTFTTICQPDLSGVMQQLAGFPEHYVPNPCFESPLLDLDPQLPGTQPDCAVSYWFPNEAREIALPRCADAPAPCWELSIDALKCPGSNHELLDVSHGPVALPEHMHVIAQCLVE
ncbi:MAG: hypothetical protein H0T89_10110 [Deltaproteobacteria bacterium]|nr:hypothetical protein [Deltaproteobacteria bacterium]